MQGCPYMRQCSFGMGQVEEIGEIALQCADSTVWPMFEMLGAMRMLQGPLNSQHLIPVAKAVCSGCQLPVTALLTVARGEFGTALQLASVFAQALSEVVGDADVTANPLLWIGAVNDIQQIGMCHFEFTGLLRWRVRV